MKAMNLDYGLMATRLEQMLADARAEALAEDTETIAKAVEAIRAEDRSDFSSWLRISIELEEARRCFNNCERPSSDYYRWAKELGLNMFYANRLPLVNKEFRRYSKDLHPFIDVEAILHLCHMAVRDPGRRRKLRASYFRMIKANGGTYVSWKTFRRKTRVKQQ